MPIDKSPSLATIVPMSKSKPKPIPLSQISSAGFRWPEFSKEFRGKWHAEIRMLLRGNSGGTIFKAVDYPDGFRGDVHFWNEMRLWAAMAHAYTDLGGDGVAGLAKDLLAAVSGSVKNKQTAFALRLSMEVPAVLELALAGVADMRVRIGAEPSEWAKEHLKAMGLSPEQIEKDTAKSGYANWPGASTP